MYLTLIQLSQLASLNIFLNNVNTKKGFAISNSFKVCSKLLLAVQVPGYEFRSQHFMKAEKNHYMYSR